MAHTIDHRSVWPTHSHRLLIQAALCESEQAIAAWQAWQGRCDIQDIDDASFFVLPRLYANLKEQIADCETTDLLRGIYRKTWTHNQLRLRGLAQAIELFTRESIPHLALQNVSLSLFQYKDIGTRALDAPDIAVPEAAFLAATSALQQHGWSAANNLPPPQLLPFISAISFRNADGHTLNLCRRVFDVDILSEYDEELYRRASPKTYNGIALHVPDEVDLLLLVCFHSRKPDAMSLCRGVLDAAVLLKQNPTIDLSEALERANDLGVVTALRDMLLFLPQNKLSLVPPKVLNRVKSHPEANSASKHSDDLAAPLRRLSTLAAMWRRHRRVLRVHDQGEPIVGFLSFLMSYTQWKVDAHSRWELPSACAKEYWRRRRRTSRSAKA